MVMGMATGHGYFSYDSTGPANTLTSEAWKNVACARNQRARKANETLRIRSLEIPGVSRDFC